MTRVPPLARALGHTDPSPHTPEKEAALLAQLFEGTSLFTKVLGVWATDTLLTREKTPSISISCLTLHGALTLMFREELRVWAANCPTCASELQWVTFTEDPVKRNKVLAPPLIYCPDCTPTALLDYSYPGRAFKLEAFSMGSMEQVAHLRDYVSSLTSSLLEENILLEQYRLAFAMINENWRALRESGLSLTGGPS